jgi:trimeric autotransporter adhesin
MKRWSSGLGKIAQRWALVSALAAGAVALAGCNDYGNTFQNPTGASITSLSPSNIAAGSPDFTITVNGTGYIAKTVVQWNQKTIASTLIMDSSGNIIGITAVVPAALVAKPGTDFVNTLSPASGAGNNGLSNTLSFIVNAPPNPVPTLTSLTPNSAAAGSPTLMLTLAGTNFLPTSDPTGGSVVHWNMGGTQTTLPATNISATSITATVSSALLVNSTAQSVTAAVSVYNAPASQTVGVGSNPTGGGGGASPGVNFTITPAGTTGMSAQNTVAEETPAVSVDGRFVAYSALQDGVSQIFVRDTCEGGPAGCQARTNVLSVAEDGITAANADTTSPSMSADGRYVAFTSAASNLVAGAPAGRQIYLRDTCVGATSGCTASTQLLSVDPSGALVGTESILPSVSASGRFIAFVAVTPSHVSKDAARSKSGATANSGFRQVFVRDTCLGVSGCTPKTTRISLQPGDESTTGEKPAGPALTGSANHVAVPGAKTATLFTRAIAVDDRVFLALTKSQ